MFVSQERGSTRKTFQKPNILRRKSKVKRLDAQKNNVSPKIMSLAATSSDTQPTMSSVLVEQQGESSQPFQIVQASQFSVINISEMCDENQTDTSQTLEIDGDSITIYAHNPQVDNNNTCASQSTLNVESFLNDGTIKQDNSIFNADSTSSPRTVETETRQKWCLDFMSEELKDTVSTTNFYDGSQLSNIYIDKDLDISIDAEILNQTTPQEVTKYKPAENLAVDPSHMKAVKFKCDMPNCNKGFWTEARLQKHKNGHNKPKQKTPTILDCPVKKTDAEGVETKCGRTFLIRNQLMKHLNEDHSPEDALFRCTLCGRRFFWAGGARAHQAGGCARAFPCGWAGCDRVFRHPCRLREHARAHTGDRPYPCQYPNCGWSFRSASKLMRHARRHTDERRHACVSCGRAFLRREHLREHAARYHAPPGTHRCTHDGCEQTFTNVSSLYLHVKKVHKNEGKPSTPKRAAKSAKAKREMFVVSLLDPTPKFDAGVEATVTVETCELTADERTETFNYTTAQDAVTEEDVTDADVTDVTDVIDDRDGRCARTHCPWPLQREQPANYALEEDTQVEQSESSESNIYTVRSDLFLHGNVLINEDSEFIISRAAAGGESASTAEGDESTLGLIDSHPTIDLMQEELMYADAVDESSFRVFLLNGEELA